MKKRVISVIAVLALCLFTVFSTKVSATEKGLWFIFTSFGEIDYVELLNQDTGVCITLGQDELFDYETFDFIDKSTRSIKLTKFYTNGEVIEQAFNLSGVNEIVGIYDDGSCGESWIEIDEQYVY